MPITVGKSSVTGARECRNGRQLVIGASRCPDVPAKSGGNLFPPAGGIRISHIHRFSLDRHGVERVAYLFYRVVRGGGSVS